MSPHYETVYVPEGRTLYVVDWDGRAIRLRGAYIEDEFWEAEDLYNSRLEWEALMDPLKDAIESGDYRTWRDEWDEDYSHEEPSGPVTRESLREYRSGAWRNPRARRNRGRPARVRKKRKKAPPGSQLPPRVLQRIRKLGVTKLPEAVIPASTIKVDFGSPKTRAVIKWKDTAGRHQSGYTPEFIAAGKAKKWSRLESMHTKIPRLKRDLEATIKRARPGSGKQQGAMLALLLVLSGLRPGGSSSIKGHYGASTMLKRHVRVDGRRIHVAYVGKSGKDNVAKVSNETLARALSRQLRGKAAGARVFGSSALEQARKQLPKGLQLKDLRTLKATKKAQKALRRERDQLRGLSGRRREKAKKRILREVTKSTAKKLSNTRKVAETAYIHPGLLASWARQNGAKARRNLTFDAKRAYEYGGPHPNPNREGEYFYVFNTPRHGLYTVVFSPEFEGLTHEGVRIVVYEISFDSTQIGVREQSKDARAFVPVLSTVKAIVEDFVDHRLDMPPQPASGKDFKRESAAYKAIGTDSRRDRIYAYMLKKAIPIGWAMEVNDEGVFFFDRVDFEHEAQALDADEQQELALILHPFAQDLDLELPDE